MREGRRQHRPIYGKFYLRRQEAGFDDEGGGRQSVDERGRDGLHSPSARKNKFQITRAPAPLCVNGLVLVLRVQRENNKIT